MTTNLNVFLESVNLCTGAKVTKKNVIVPPKLKRITDVRNDSAAMKLTATTFQENLLQHSLKDQHSMVPVCLPTEVTFWVWA